MSEHGAAYVMNVAMFLFSLFFCLSFIFEHICVHLLKFRVCTCLQYVYFVAFLELVRSQLNMYIKLLFRPREIKMH